MCISYITFNEPPLWPAAEGLEIESTPPSEVRPAQPLVLQASAGKEVQIWAFLRALRGTPESRFTPVFFNTTPSPRLASLGDGQIETPDKAGPRARRMAEREAQLAPGLLDMGADFRLLGYLYAHEAELRPVPDSEAATYYRYHLAESLADEGVDVRSWLARLEEIRLLEAEELIDRLRLCPQCQSARLNYLDICSTCSSLRIVKTSFLHCFTCGHVAPEESFFKEGRLNCPNCRTRLRHIGSDYDRALENYLCQNCGSRQAEPQVVARCMACGRSTPPDELTTWEVRAYRLSSRGESTALLGNADYLLTRLDVLNFTRFDVFIGILDWLLKLHHRYQDLCFGLIGLRLPNLADLTARLGSGQAAALIDAFVDRLRELVRDTDLISRSDRGTLWLALPRTDAEGCALVHNRVKKLQADSALADGSQLDFVSVSWTAGSDPAFDSAELLLAAQTSVLDEETQTTQAALERG